MSRSLILFAALLPGLAHAGWRDDVSKAREACAADPAPCEVVDTLLVRESRAGTWFAQDHRLTIDMTGVLLERLLRETEPQLRTALAHGASTLFLDDPSSEWHEAWAELAASDPVYEVRSLLVTSLRRAPMSAAGPGLRGALAHSDARTRLDAAAVMGGQTDAPAFVDDLLGALSDPSPAVRARVVRALGHAGDARALPALEALDTAGDEVLDKERVRAISRLQG